MTDAAEKLLREAADTLNYLGHKGGYSQCQHCRLVDRIRAHLSTPAQPAASVGDVNGGWISVADRLPDDRHLVLIGRDDIAAWIPPMIAFRHGGKWYEDEAKPDLLATHWREIPRLPAAPTTAASGMDAGGMSDGR